MIELPDGFVIGAVNLGQEFLKQTSPPYVARYTMDSETDSSNDPVLYDKEPSLPCLCYNIGAKSSWAEKLSGGQFCETLDLERTVDESQSNIKVDSNSKATADQHNKDTSKLGLSGSSLYLCGYSGKNLSP